MSSTEKTIEEMETNRREIAKILSETDENIREYKLLELALKAVDEQIKTYKDAIQKFEKQINSDPT